MVSVSMRPVRAAGAGSVMRTAGDRCSKEETGPCRPWERTNECLEEGQIPKCRARPAVLESVLSLLPIRITCVLAGIKSVLAAGFASSEEITCPCN